MKPRWVYLSIGSNLGDPLHNCCKGIAALVADGQVVLEHRSPFYWTEPMDYTDQQWFINAAMKVTTGLTPLELLVRLQRVQQSMGRKTGTIRSGPRILDLDIIFYEDWIINTPELTIPHPRMHKRRFVLQPICDIDPKVRHPVLLQEAGQLLNQIEIKEQRIRPCCCDC